MVKEVACFKTNELRIAYATARTLCSYHLDKKELYFDIIASLLGHFNLITRNNHQYLNLKSDRLKRLRDFSKTSRIGELAQGINYLFVQERLNYPFIIDFHLFQEKSKKPASHKKTPDFVTLNIDFSQIGLLESKGEAQKGFKITGKNGKLKEALVQLESANWPSVNHLIPCCVRFEEDISSLKSGIHYSKIRKKQIKNSELQLRMFKQHFASWFYLVGDFTRASILIDGGNIENLENDERYEIGTDDKAEKIYWLKRPISINFDIEGEKSSIHLYTHFIHQNDFNIGIYESVITQIVRGNLDNKTFPFSINSEGNYKRFADGTLIRLSSNIYD
ncbi:hypothetical protein EWU22_01600 [Aquirufa nivalisilvae]|nr:hypothetical protein EWU22_01600 [Aquirufa nivalisilvae]